MSRDHVDIGLAASMRHSSLEGAQGKGSLDQDRVLAALPHCRAASWARAEDSGKTSVPEPTPLHIELSVPAINCTGSPFLPVLWYRVQAGDPALRSRVRLPLSALGSLAPACLFNVPPQRQPQSFLNP